MDKQVKKRIGATLVLLFWGCMDLFTTAAVLTIYDFIERRIWKKKE